MLSTVIFEFFGTIFTAQQKERLVSGTKELIEELLEQSVTIYFYLPSSFTYPISTLLNELETLGYPTAILSFIQWITTDEFQNNILYTNFLQPPLLLVATDFYHDIMNQAQPLPVIAYLNHEYSNMNYSNVSCLLESFDTIDYACIEEEYLRALRLPVTIATTDRLELREITTSELPQVYELYRNSTHSRYIDSLDSPQEELRKHEAYIENMYQFYRLGLYGIFLKSTNQLIGRCGLQPVMINDEDSEIELAYHIDPDFLHQGYAYESIKEMLHYAKEYHSLDSIVAIIHPQNIASSNLAKKIGMHFEKSISYKSETYELYRINFA